MKKTQRQDRILALERFRQGESVSSIANSLGYSRRWVYKWIERSRMANPEVPWPEDRSRRPRLFGNWKRWAWKTTFRCVRSTAF